MRQRRRVVGVVGTCLMSTTILGAGMTAQTPAAKVTSAKVWNCRPRINPNESVHLGGYRDAAGKVHFTVSYDRDVQPAQRVAFRAAMKMWNAYSESTLIVLEETTSGEVDFLVRRGAPRSKARFRDEDGTCSSYESDGSLIWYSPSNMAWADADLPAAARIYAHEIGHGLNIDHKSGQSVMVGSTGEDPCRYMGNTVLMDVQQSDADDAYHCAHYMHRDVEYRRPPSRR
jgi:hypothetical protein